jgi:O-antigen/teichoic acid export membrane protein
MRQVIPAECFILPLFVGKWNFDKTLLRSMLKYSLPLLLLGVAGIMNQTIDKIIFPMVYPNPAEAMRELGIYGACFKVAMEIMMRFMKQKEVIPCFILVIHGRIRR